MMKKWIKVSILLIVILVSSYIVLRLTILKSFKLTTGLMENTINKGALLICIEKQFQPERNDIIAHHFPEGDTVLIPQTKFNYYVGNRIYGRNVIDSRYKKSFVSLKDREIWIGRCVGLPGDKIEIIQTELFVNGQIYENENVKKRYTFKFKDNIILSKRLIKKVGLKHDDIENYRNYYILNLTKQQVELLKEKVQIEKYYVITDTLERYDSLIFPFSKNYKWNSDFLGEIIIPQKNFPIYLTKDNLPLYRRIIEAYEHNKLQIINDDILINGVKSKEYIPKMNYYFVINDNRSNSLDSRYWGFLPEDHIVSKIFMIFNP